MLFRRLVCSMVLFAFGLTGVIPPPAYSQSIPDTPAHILSLTAVFHPVMVQGMRVHPENPLRFDFIVDTGDTSVDVNGIPFKEETTKLIKYFLASLTVPEKEMWVNLSPYEKNRIIADGLGHTGLGEDMLFQDFILKQLTSSLIYPDSTTGKSFWEKVYAKARETFGRTDVPVNTFNKVWIVPDKAVVYERGNTVYIAESHLKVMLEEDYLALSNHVSKGPISSSSQSRVIAGPKGEAISERTTNSVEIAARPSVARNDTRDVNALGSQIIREIVLPELEKEVNTGKNFANLRQIYNAMILAVWFKVNLQKSLLGQVYADKNKTTGVDAADKAFRRKIYEQYIKSFKKGVYNYIREENDPATGEMVPRKYFSGGLRGVDAAMLQVIKTGPVPPLVLEQQGERVLVTSNLQEENPQGRTPPDAAMLGNDDSLSGILSNAKAALEEDNFEEAQTEYEKVLGANPHNTEALNGIAQIELKRGQLDKSREVYKQVLQLDERNTIAHNGLARILAMEGKVKDAIDGFNFVLSDIDPDNEEALEGMSSLYWPSQGNYTRREYTEIFSGMVSSPPVYHTFNLLWGSQPFELWLKDKRATRFKVKGLMGLAVTLDEVFSQETSGPALEEFIREYIAPHNYVHDYLTKIIRSLPPTHGLNRISADVHHIYKAYFQPEEYLKQLHVYLDGLEGVFEGSLKSLPERIVDSGLHWQPQLERNVLFTDRYEPLETGRVREFLDDLNSQGERTLDGRDLIFYEDAGSGLTVWGNPIVPFPEGNYLYDNPNDARNQRMKELWKAQEGNIAQVFIGYRSEGIKVPVAMVETASQGEAVFLFLAPEKVADLLPLSHSNHVVRVVTDLIRQKMSLAGPNPDHFNKAIEDIHKEAQKLAEFKNAVVNVRGATGTVIGQTDDYYFIQSVKHIVTGPDQRWDVPQVRVSFYAGGFRDVFLADVLNRGDYFEGGASAGFGDDVLLMRVAKKGISDSIKEKIRVPLLSDLKKDSPDEWTPAQPVAFMGLIGPVHSKRLEISFGYTSTVPTESQEDAHLTGNIPVVAHYEIGYSGGPIMLSLFGQGDQGAMVGSLTRIGWTPVIQLGFYMPIEKILDKMIDMHAIEEFKNNPPERTSHNNANAAMMGVQITHFPLASVHRIIQETSGKSSVVPIVAKKFIGEMPVGFNKQLLYDGRLDIVYNPEGANEYQFPKTKRLENAEKIFIHYSYDDSGKVISDELVKTQEGTWQIAINGTERHDEIHFSFSDDHGRQDDFKYKTYLFFDQHGKPIPLTDGHVHANLEKHIVRAPLPENYNGYELVDTMVPRALMSGGMEHALFFDRDNIASLKILEAYPQLRALAWVTLSDEVYGNNRTIPRHISTVDEIMALLKENPRFVGLKLHPTLDKVKLDDERVKRFLRPLEELSRENLKHPGGRKYVVLAHSDGYWGEPAQFEELAKEFRDINFIFGHIYISDDRAKRMKAIKIAKENKNVFLETSWAPMDVIMDAIKGAEGVEGAPDKVIWGTDAMGEDHFSKKWENGGRRSYGDMTRYLHEHLTAEEFALLMSGNAERLFGFDETIEKDGNNKVKVREWLEAIQSQGLPRVAEIPPPEGSEHDVMADQVTWLTEHEIPVKIISGTPLNIPLKDNQEYAYIEELNSLGKNAPAYQDAKREEFRKMEERIYERVMGQIADQDIIIIHNVMTVRDHLPFTAAMQRIILDNPQKQFIFYIHNAEESRQKQYQLSLPNPTPNLPNVRYVTVNDSGNKLTASQLAPLLLDVLQSRPLLSNAVIALNNKNEGIDIAFEMVLEAIRISAKAPSARDEYLNDIRGAMKIIREHKRIRNTLPDESYDLLINALSRYAESEYSLGELRRMSYIFSVLDERSRYPRSISLIELGLAIKEKGLLTLSLRVFERAIKLNERNTQARIEIAGILAREEDMEGAKSMYRQVLGIDPANEHAKQGLAHLDSLGNEAMISQAIHPHPDTERAKDRAVLATPASSSKKSESRPGGIDLDPKMLNLQVKRDGNGMAFPAAAGNAMQVNGFTPVIIRITPMATPLLSDSGEI